jgi:spoIIIJ-associated protein
MIYQFEGKTEKDAVDKAAAELGLGKDQFDVEILETQKGGLFKKGLVKIQVHTEERPQKPVELPDDSDSMGGGYRGNRSGNKAPAYGTPGHGTPMRGVELEPADDFERSMIDYVVNVLRFMGFKSTVAVQAREEKKICFNINSTLSAMIIGKRGKNIDALQVIANIYSGRLGRQGTRIVLDSESYRLRREESIVRLAYEVADRVRESRRSILLEPMNPFERRIVHTTLADIAEVETLSEGDGMYKQVRVSYCKR